MKFDWDTVEVLRSFFNSECRINVEYTDCTAAEGPTPPHSECPRYDTKQSDGEVLMVNFGNAEYPFIAVAPRSTLARRSST